MKGLCPCWSRFAESQRVTRGPNRVSIPTSFISIASLPCSSTAAKSRWNTGPTFVNHQEDYNRQENNREANNRHMAPPRDSTENERRSSAVSPGCLLAFHPKHQDPDSNPTHSCRPSHFLLCQWSIHPIIQALFKNTKRDTIEKLEKLCRRY